MGERPAAVEGTGLVPCPLPRAQKTCLFIAKGFFFFISFFRRKHLLPNVLALSRITQRVCGYVDPRLSALP